MTLCITVKQNGYFNLFVFISGSKYATEITTNRHSVFTVKVIMEFFAKAICVMSTAQSSYCSIIPGSFFLCSGTGEHDITTALRLQQ